MRLQRYLNEKYYNSLKEPMDGRTYEVFVNPTKKEMREIPPDGTMFRWIIDFKHKKFYAFSARTFHERVMNMVNELPNFRDFWNNGVGVDYIATGDWNSFGIGSDSLSWFGNRGKNDDKQKKLLILAKQDWSWVTKYMSADDVRRIQWLIANNTYITEKYLNTIHQSYKNIDAEVFINPSRKELINDVVKDNGGMRFIIDFKKKNFYAFDVRMFHETVMNAVSDLPNFKPYWDNGVGLDYIYTGNTYRTEVGSDALERFADDREFYPKLFKLRKQNWSWVDKYVSADGCIDTIEMVIGQQ